MDPENLHALRLDTLASDPGEVVAHYKSDTRTKMTHLPYRNDYIGRFTVRGGRIASFAEYLDPIRYVIAIGGRVDPRPPGPHRRHDDAQAQRSRIPLHPCGDRRAGRSEPYRALALLYQFTTAAG